VTHIILPLALLLAASPGIAAQTPSAQSGSARLVAFTNEPREPEFGEVFLLNVQVRVAPEVVAFLSDTLAEAANSVSAGPGTWTVTPGPGDSLDVRASYPVMGLLPGGVELPLIELWTRAAAAGESPGVRPASDLAASDVASPGTEHALLYLGGVFIMPPSAMVGDDAMLLPRPPADVFGGEQSPWLLAAFLLGGLAVVVVATLLVRGRTRGSTDAFLVLSPKAEALRELDRIRALGWHTNGRVGDFYEATTGSLRHSAQPRDPRPWAPAITISVLRAVWGHVCGP
jgi:hypothetical protein